MGMLLACLGSALVVIAGDQILKSWATDALSGGKVIEVIPGLFSFQYTTNYGAAGGIFEGGRWVFVGLTVVVVAVCIYLCLKVYPFTLTAERFAITLLLAGAVGNMIDRVVLGYVVDFAALWIIPVFNLADMVMVFATATLIGLIAFRKDRRRAWSNERIMNRYE